MVAVKGEANMAIVRKTARRVFLGEDSVVYGGGWETSPLMEAGCEVIPAGVWRACRHKG